MKYPSRRMLFVTTATALSSFHSNATTAAAFVPSRPVPVPSILTQVPTTLQTRLYSSSNNNEQEEGGFLATLGKAAKSILPKSWFQSKQEREHELARKQLENQMSGQITQMLRDFPLPVRVLGSLVAPMFSGMATMLQQEAQQVEDLMEQARGHIRADPAVMAALGEPLQLQAPFSQSSSSTNINGQLTKQVQASFVVQGTMQQGIATLTATERGIQQISMKVNDGRVLNVSLSRRKDEMKRPSLGKNPINKNDIIDVEFVEKKNNK